MFFRRFIKLLLSISLLITVHVSTAQDVPYLDPKLDVEVRVDDLLARMALEEKIGQTTLVEKDPTGGKTTNCKLVNKLL